MQLALTGNNTGQKIILPNGIRLTEEESDIYSADNPNLP